MSKFLRTITPIIPYWSFKLLISLALITLFTALISYPVYADSNIEKREENTDLYLKEELAFKTLREYSLSKKPLDNTTALELGIARPEIFLPALEEKRLKEKIKESQKTPENALSQIPDANQNLTKQAPSTNTGQVAGVWQGVASYYSISGCIGCRADRLMANGQPLSDNSLTIAFMRAPLNSTVRVTNLNNNVSVIARITDTGGFESLGKIADLTLGVKNAIGGEDLTPVKIELLL
jgi:rare lipoprotein A (peptidoglycan hydrolase)